MRWIKDWSTFTFTTDQKDAEATREHGDRARDEHGSVPKLLESIMGILSRRGDASAQRTPGLIDEAHFVHIFSHACAGKKVAIASCTESVCPASSIPGITIRSFDGHLVQLPGVVTTKSAGRIHWAVVATLCITARIIIVSIIFTVEAYVGIAFVETRFLHKKAFTLLRQRATAVPMEGLPEAVLQHIQGANRRLTTAGIEPPGMTFRDRGLWARKVLVMVMKIAGFGSVVTPACRSGVVGVGGIEKPHGVSLRLICFVHKRRSPHLLAQILAR